MINLNYIKDFNYYSKKSYHNCNNFFKVALTPTIYDPENFEPVFGLYKILFGECSTKIKMNADKYKLFLINNPKIKHIRERAKYQYD